MELRASLSKHQQASASIEVGARAAAHRAQSGRSVARQIGRSQTTQVGEKPPGRQQLEPSGRLQLRRIWPMCSERAPMLLHLGCHQDRPMYFGPSDVYFGASAVGGAHARMHSQHPLPKGRRVRSPRVGRPRGRSRLVRRSGRAIAMAISQGCDRAMSNALVSFRDQNVAHAGSSGPAPAARVSVHTC